MPKPVWNFLKGFNMTPKYGYREEMRIIEDKIMDKIEERLAKLEAVAEAVKKAMNIQCARYAAGQMEPWWDDVKDTLKALDGDTHG